MGVMGSQWCLWDSMGVLGSPLGSGVLIGLWGGLKGSQWGSGVPMGFMGQLWGSSPSLVVVTLTSSPGSAMGLRWETPLRAVTVKV